VPQIVDNIKALLGQKPMFGICMGHQILGQVGTAALSQRSGDRLCHNRPCHSRSTWCSRTGHTV
jgi:carbamoylphosphate synthase small subunit